MKRRTQLIFLLAILAVFGVALFVAVRGGGKSELAELKAKLRAQGEMLTYEEMGYPRPIPDQTRFARLEANIRLLPKAAWFSRAADWQYAAPGLVTVPWTKPQFEYEPSSASGFVSWVEAANQMAPASAALSEIHEYLRRPDTHSVADPASVTNWVSAGFVAQRNLAQWLRAHLVVSLHEGGARAALPDLHSLVGLCQLHEEDPVLVTQMIRIAILNLTCTAAWDVLQSDGLGAEDLARLRLCFEELDAYRNLERGWIGDRAAVENFLSQVRHGDPRAGKYLPGYQPLHGFWKLGVDANELVLLQALDANLQAVRRAQQGVKLAQVAAEAETIHQDFQRKTGGSLNLQFTLARMAMPNMPKTLFTAARAETMRRMVVLALAIKEFELTRGTTPASLDQLVPGFLPRMPTDPMSGEPFEYSVVEGKWLLYSVGEDGRDDGGDPTPVEPGKKPGLWEGRDAVWPRSAGSGSGERKGK